LGNKNVTIVPAPCCQINTDINNNKIILEAGERVTIQNYKKTWYIVA
jgi:hypothetical protein